jgi:hypothetical protein
MTTRTGTPSTDQARPWGTLPMTTAVLTTSTTLAPPECHGVTSRSVSVPPSRVEDQWKTSGRPGHTRPHGWPTDGPDGAHHWPNPCVQVVFRWANTANGSTDSPPLRSIVARSLCLPASSLPSSRPPHCPPSSHSPPLPNRAPSCPLSCVASGPPAPGPSRRPGHHTPHHSGEFGESLEDFLPKFEELADVYRLTDQEKVESESLSAPSSPPIPPQPRRPEPRHPVPPLSPCKAVSCQNRRCLMFSLLRRRHRQVPGPKRQDPQQQRTTSRTQTAQRQPST